MMGSNVSLQMKGRNTFVILRGKPELMMAFSFLGAWNAASAASSQKGFVLLQVAKEILSNQTSKIRKMSK